MQILEYLHKRAKQRGEVMHRVNQRERLNPMNIYRKEIARARLGVMIANPMGFIFALALYDKFDLTFKQITNYYTKTVNKRVA